MTRYWLVGAAAFAMMSGVALAQSSSDSTTSTTTTNGPPIVGSYSASKTQRTIDADGTETKKSQSYQSGSGGTSATSSSRTQESDGSRLNTYHEEHSNSPVGDLSTTTTTINR